MKVGGSVERAAGREELQHAWEWAAAWVLLVPLLASLGMGPDCWM